jgi:hypothetical protein
MFLHMRVTSLGVRWCRRHGRFPVELGGRRVLLGRVVPRSREASAENVAHKVGLPLDQWGPSPASDQLPVEIWLVTDWSAFRPIDKKGQANHE